MKTPFTITLISLVSLFLLCFFRVTISNMPYNPVRTGQSDADFITLFPEGWAFFTRDPREDQVYLYQKNDDGEIVEVPYRNVSQASWFGFNRRERAKGIEIGHLFEQVAKKDWFECKGDLNNCSELDTLKATGVLNISYAANFCGEYFIVSKPIVPWAWSKSKDKIKMPSKIIKINALCSSSKT